MKKSGLRKKNHLEHTVLVVAKKLEKDQNFTVTTNGKVLTNGGRVLGVTALGADLKQAVDKAYKAIDLIQFEGIYFRRDIAQKGLRRMGFD